MVVGGAEAGLLIGTAAILAGTDSAKIAGLLVTDGMKDEAIMHRAHRNGYDHGVRGRSADRRHRVRQLDVAVPAQVRAQLSDGAGRLPDVALGQSGCTR